MRCSNGRMEFGIGSSWLEEEWTAAGLDFSARPPHRREHRGMPEAWSEEIIEYHGSFFDFDQVAFNPKPHQRPHPALIIGGDGAAAQRRAAIVGDGWFPIEPPTDELPNLLRKINETRSEAGRPGLTTLTLSSGTSLRPDLTLYRDLGVARLIVRPYTGTRTAIDEMRRFGETVLARFN